MLSLCLRCKGSRALCGLTSCPLLKEYERRTMWKSKKELMGITPPNLFVGRMGYPNVYWGPMVSEEEKVLMEPDFFGRSTSEIVEERSKLLRGKNELNVYKKTPMLEKAQEIILSLKPIDVEVRFKREPSFGMHFSPITTPMGPSAPIEKLDVVDNAQIPKRVDEIQEEGMKASEAVDLLRKYDVYYVSRVLSSGILGVEKNRKLVPTRWSITATDDIIGRKISRKILDFPEINEILLYSIMYMDNHYEILLMPGAWEYEQFEAWAPKTYWTTDSSAWEIVQEYELWRGRKNYAEKEAGGYYAGRLGVLEHLERIGRQARVLLIREIYEGFIIPVGVWQVRESVRHGMKTNPEKFSNIEEALARINERTRIPIKEYRKKSEILKFGRLDYYM